MPNPNLGPERTTNYELGWKGRFAHDTKLAAALFYSDVRDLIQTVQVGPGQKQTQNVGDGHYYGFEISAETALSQQVSIGGNYTYIYRTIKDPLQPNLRPTGAYTLANIQTSYKVTDNFEVAGGVKNLLDQNFELAWGLPQPGRTFYVKARAIF